MSDKSKRETGSLQQKKIQVSCAVLVRLNLNALLRDLATKDQHWNEMLDEYEEFMRLGDKYKGRWRFKSGSYDNSKKLDYQRWAMSRLAKRLYVIDDANPNKDIVGRVRKIINSRQSKGSDDLPIEEVVRFAIEVGVSPTYLLQPLREWLETDSILEFVNFGPTGLTISARDWLLYVHGLKGIGGKELPDFYGQMLNFSAEQGLFADASKPYFLNEEEERISNAKRSPIVPKIEGKRFPKYGHEYSDDAPTLPEPHPMDLLPAPTTYLQRVHARTRAVILLLHLIRHAFLVADSDVGMSHRKEDIEWYLNQLRAAFSELGKNAAPLEPTKITKSVYVGKKPETTE